MCVARLCMCTQSGSKPSPSLRAAAAQLFRACIVPLLRPPVLHHRATPAHASFLPKCSSPYEVVLGC